MKVFKLLSFWQFSQHKFSPHQYFYILVPLRNSLLLATFISCPEKETRRLICSLISSFLLQEKLRGKHCQMEFKWQTFSHINFCKHKKWPPHCGRPILHIRFRISQSLWHCLQKNKSKNKSLMLFYCVGWLHFFAKGK